MPPSVESLPAIVDQNTSDISALKSRVDALEARPNAAPVADNIDSFDSVHSNAQMFAWMNTVLHKYFGGDMPPVEPTPTVDPNAVV